MADDYQRLLQAMARLERQFKDTHRNGKVHEVKGTKLRMELGKDKDGQPILSPWLNTSDMRGGAREQKFYEKGQTLSIICPGGDIAQGMIAPYAPNKDFPTPEHADKSGQNEESYQLKDYRSKNTKEGHDNWLQDDEEQKKGGQDSGASAGGGGGGGGGGGSAQSGGSGQKKEQKGHVGGSKAKLKQRMNAKTGFTTRFGTDTRNMVDKKGVKMRAKSDWVVVTAGNIIMSRPPIIGKDPMKNDDA